MNLVLNPYVLSCKKTGFACCEEIDNLINQFNLRFDSLDNIRPLGTLYRTPLKCDVASQPACFHVELQAIQCEIICVHVLDVWKDVYLILWFWMLWTTYCCDKDISVMKLIKDYRRSRLNNSSLNQQMKFSLINISVYFDELIEISRYIFFDAIYFLSYFFNIIKSLGAMS